jgi:hypothetical protein
MTYVIGLKSHGINSIISDARVTFSQGDKEWGTNTMLKTGGLFPGCIFGVVGVLDQAEAFIRSVKTHLAIVPIDAIPGFWNRFEQFVSNYNFPTGKSERFRLLLSSCASGEPRFYLIDSEATVKLVDCHEDWIMLGSGSAILDKRIAEDYRLRLDQIHEFPSVKGQPNENLADPYLMCLWLTELSQSVERQELEDIGVGGVFHFIFQTATSSHTQLPSVYVLCDVNREKTGIWLWYYRVCFVDSWLVIDTCIPPGKLVDSSEGEQVREAFLAEIALPLKENGTWDVKSLEAELRAKIDGELDKQPFYFFCGFGYKDPRLRKNFLFQITTKGDYVFSREGIVRPDIAEMLFENL